jgi:hypothetical protein
MRPRRRYVAKPVDLPRAKDVSEAQAQIGLLRFSICCTARHISELEL